MILFDQKNNTFTVENRAEKRKKCFLPSLVNAWDTYVYFIGGYYVRGGETLKTVRRYDLSNAKFGYEMPALNFGRILSTGCVLGSFIFIFGGYDGQETYYNSIERLNIASTCSSASILWELI